MLNGVLAADMRHLQKFTRSRRTGLSWALQSACLPGVWAVVLFRLAQACWQSRLKPLAMLLYALNYVLSGADLAPGARIGPGLTLPHPNGVVVPDGAVIGCNAAIFQQVTIGTAGRENGVGDGFPRLGDDVTLFTGCRVIGPIVLGDGVFVGANAVVTKSVPARAIVAGVPATILRYRTDPLPGDQIVEMRVQTSAHAALSTDDV